MFEFDELKMKFRISKYGFRSHKDTMSKVFLKWPKATPTHSPPLKYMRRRTKEFFSTQSLSFFIKNLVQICLI